MSPAPTKTNLQEDRSFVQCHGQAKRHMFGTSQAAGKTRVALINDVKWFVKTWSK